jgi:hypothetical protein
MSTLHKEYHKLPDTAKSKYAGQEIKMSISFNKDSHPWFSNQPIDKGYRVCVVPVKTTRYESGIVMEKSGAMTGFNDTLLKIDRQSAKRLQQAIDILHQNVDKYMLWFVETEEMATI